MTENIEQMRNRHKMEIEKLRENCTHVESTPWTEWYWALGHKAHTLRRWCKFCGTLTGEKEMQEQNPHIAEFQKPNKPKPKTTRFKKMLES